MAGKATSFKAKIKVRAGESGVVECWIEVEADDLDGLYELIGQVVEDNKRRAEERNETGFGSNPVAGQRG